MNLITFMFHHGMLILGSPYSIKEMHSTKGGGTPYGPSSVSGNQTNLANDEKIIAENTVDTKELCEIANDNCPGQVILSGTENGVIYISDILKNNDHTMI